MEDINEYSKKPDDFIHIDINEHQAINFLLDAFEGNDSKGSDLNIFNNLLYGEHYLQNWSKYSGCYCLRNFLIKDMGLYFRGKPGEIDILLIPFDKDKVFYEKASAFEVKVTKPRFENINKGANSDGYSQIMGLIKIGFPYVGIIHVVLSTPLPEESKPDVKFMKRPLNAHEDKEISWPGVDEYEMIKIDWLPFYAERNQMRRLLSYDIPKYVGLKSLSLNFCADGTYALGFSEDFKAFETGYLNPHRSRETIELIKRHHRDFGNLYKKINLNFPWASTNKK